MTLQQIRHDGASHPGLLADCAKCATTDPNRPEVNREARAAARRRSQAVKVATFRSDRLGRVTIPEEQPAMPCEVHDGIPVHQPGCDHVPWREFLDAAEQRLTDAIATSDRAAEQASRHAMEAILALIPQHPDR